MMNKKMLTGLALVASMVVAAPAMSKGKVVEPPPPAGSELSVYCIDWTPTGGHDQHPHVQVAVVDQDGNAVLGAEVRLDRTFNGEPHTADFGGSTGTGGGLDDGVDCPNGPLGTGFTSDFCINNAATGYYDVEVISVSKDGYTWDGVSPSAGAGYDHVRWKD